MSHIKENYTFITGTATKADAACFVVQDDETMAKKDLISSTIIFNVDGKWINGGMVPWPIIGIGMCTIPVKEMVAISPHGKVYVTGGPDMHEENINLHPEGLLDTGELRCARVIDGKMYVAGMGRQVYVRTASQQWVPIDQTCRIQEYSSDVFGFESIDGFGPNDIYAVGRGGEIWHFDGNLWQKIQSPTNRILTNVYCAKNGTIYACGRSGTLLRSKNNVWEIVDNKGPQLDFWSLCWFQNKLYISSLKGVFILNEDDTLSPVDFGNHSPTTTMHVVSSQDSVWSIGAKDVFQNKGSGWVRIE